MRKNSVESLLLAQDVYSLWQQKVKSAKEEITIFAPFMDRLVLSLLSNNAVLSRTAIKVITNFSAESLLEMPNQLKTIKRLLQEGAQVYRLDNLHAKILLIDNSTVVFGSQNFTSHARKKFEVSASPLPPLDGSDFLEKLQQWIGQATLVKEDYIDLLLNRLRRYRKKYRGLVGEVAETIQQSEKEYEKEELRKFLIRLGELGKESNIQFDQGEATATITTIFNRRNSYCTLLADRKYELTRWSVVRKNRVKKPYSLDRLYFFPMLIPETMRMGFARVGKGQITYIRDEINWDVKWPVGNLSLNVKIAFPKVNTKHRNIVIALNNSNYGSCECRFLFTGENMRIVKRNYHRGFSCSYKEHKDFRQLLEKEFFGKSEKLDEFINQYFKRFVYERLGREEHNIRQYLTGNKYHLSLIQYLDNPVLIVTDMQNL